MTWFWLSIVALLCWSGSDLFSKIGCRDADDKHAHLKMTTAVGVVMGLHAAFEIFVNGVAISWHIIWLYLPVSILYILSMALGYVGLRYIELSVSSPICNSSGALVALASILFMGGGAEMVPMQFVAGRTPSFGPPGRRSPITNMPNPGSHWPCRWPTAYWTPPGPSPTIL